MRASGTKICDHCVRVLYFDLEGKGVSNGLFDDSDVLLCINHGEITCMTCLCGSKDLRRVCAGFAQGLRRVCAGFAQGLHFL